MRLIRSFRYATAYDALILIIITISSWILVYNLIPAVEFKTFYHAAQAVTMGRSPYPIPGKGTIRQGHAFVYPVTTLIYFLPYSFLPFKAALPLWRVTELLFLLGGIVLLKGRLGIAISAIVAVSSFALTALQVASIEPLLLLLLAISWRFRENTFISTIALALAISAKLFLLPILLWLVLTKRYKSFIISGTLIVALILPTMDFMPSVQRYYEILHLLSNHESASGLSIVSTLYLVLHSLTAAFWTTVALAIVFAVLTAYYYFHRPKWCTEEYLLGAMIIWSLIESPITWSHYYVLAVVPILLVFEEPLFATAIFAAMSWLLTQPDQISIRVLPIALLAIGILVTLLNLATNGHGFQYLHEVGTRMFKKPKFSTSIFVLGGSILLLISTFLDAKTLPSLSFDLCAIAFYVLLSNKVFNVGT